MPMTEAEAAPAPVPQPPSRVEARYGLEARATATPPALPALSTPSSCPTTSQNTQCSSGIPYCCSTGGDGGHTCVNGVVNCQQTVICCNNAIGMQVCIGNIDFNMPITINVNLPKE
ncbi:hypothetical protein BGZ60DRAFT_535808 [Tricladium varicosporioides]|nr:hypothetical protein BGZ60DRAFT_535808 [Hymenoscyphus varicosporioides]